MTQAIGLIKDSVSDARSGKLVFLSHCMLNQNACVRGLASQPAVIREVVDLALQHQVGMFQIPCPEVSYLGSMRWGMVKKMYGSPMFRRHCRAIASQVCDQVQTYRDNGHWVLAIALRDGSPTCGLGCSAVEADPGQQWGGVGLARRPAAALRLDPGGLHRGGAAGRWPAAGMDDLRLLLAVPRCRRPADCPPPWPCWTAALRDASAAAGRSPGQGPGDRLQPLSALQTTATGVC